MKGKKLAEAHLPSVGSNGLSKAEFDHFDSEMILNQFIRSSFKLQTLTVFVNKNKIFRVIIFRLLSLKKVVLN